MNCVTWLGRLLNRVLVTGLYPSFGENGITPDKLRCRYMATSTKRLGQPHESGGWASRRTGCSSECNVNNNNPAKNMIKAFHNQLNEVKVGPGFVSAVSGLPKDFSTATFRQGQFGDDAWFIAKNKNADVIGVADGVGGWRTYGLDPGEFSFSLMKACENLVQVEVLSASKPELLLASAFNRVQKNNNIQGSSTACVLVLNRNEAILYCANLGDSGFLIMRRGQIVHRSEEQIHCFNTPFQLSCPPPGENVLCDSPEAADTSHLHVEDGDLILLATDGVFDNLPDSILVAELRKVEGVKDPLHLQTAANTIALMARTLAFDSKYMSPFAKSAQMYGINTVGGKPDDVTVLLATVSMS